MKELYHGTIAMFDVIDVNAGKGYKDFGKGFYATAVVSHAENICQKVIEQLKPENLPKQYFFRTEEAIKTLKFSTVKRQVVG